MANYPTSLPSTTPATHTVVNDEIVAIATELGLVPKGSAASVAARLAAGDPLTFARYVYHGATAGAARPTGTGLVIWVGSVTPTNALSTDVTIIGAASDTTPPSAPTAVTSPAQTSGSIDLSWTASTDNVAVTGYEVFLNGSATPAVSPTGTTVTVTGLTAATTYAVTVKARDAAGNRSAASTSINVTTLAGTTAPGAPTGLTGTPGNGQVSVAFTPPVSNGGSAITSYAVTSSPGNLTTTGAGSPIVATGLTNGTAYTFTATATNAVGTSVASAPSAAVTPATVPGAPTIGTATGGSGQATVAFTAPASNGGSAITGYTATSTPGGLTGTGTTSPLTVTGLTNGTAYTFTVTATNAVGTSAPSAASNSVTPAAASAIASTAGLQAWNKADAISGKVDLDPISRWDATAGALNAPYYVQGTAAAQPLYRTGVVNTKPVLRFDATDDKMSPFQGTTVAWGLLTVGTVFIVAKFAAGAANGATLFDSSAGTNLFRLYRNSATTMQLFSGASITSGATTPEAWHIYCAVRNGSAAGSLLAIDGNTSAVTGTLTSTANYDGVLLGATAAGAAANADIAEVAVYNTVVSAADRLAIFNELGTKYGITIT